MRGSARFCRRESGRKSTNLRSGLLSSVEARALWAKAMFAPSTRGPAANIRRCCQNTGIPGRPRPGRRRRARLNCYRVRSPRRPRRQSPNISDGQPIAARRSVDSEAR
jgi:hypothetical protein